VQTCPRMPDTVRMLAPSNRATSSLDVNMPFTIAVFCRPADSPPIPRQHASRDNLAAPLGPHSSWRLSPLG
jgi:hypothetical protein